MFHSTIKSTPCKNAGVVHNRMHALRTFIVTNEETEQADVPQNEHPPVLCMSGGVFVLTLQQIRKAIFPAVSLPENPAKK